MWHFYSHHCLPDSGTTLLSPIDASSPRTHAAAPHIPLRGSVPVPGSSWARWVSSGYCPWSWACSYPSTQGAQTRASKNLNSIWQMPNESQTHCHPLPGPAEAPRRSLGRMQVVKRHRGVEISLVQEDRACLMRGRRRRRNLLIRMLKGTTLSEGKQ